MTYDIRRADVTRRRWHTAWLLLALGLLVQLAATPSHAVAPSSTATVAGTVVLATTGGALAQARVCVLGTSRCATTAADGQYTLGGVAAGSRTLRFTRAGHATLDVPLALRAGQRATLRSAMVPKPVGNELRIVLSWGTAPADLDAYLWVPQGGRAYRVEPGQRGSLAGFPFAVLQRGDSDGQGPEHIYVSSMQRGRSTFAVRNSSAQRRMGSQSLAGSGAVVEVYDRNGLRRRFTAPTRGSGTWWTVFQYTGSNDLLTAVGTLSDVPPDASPTATPTATPTRTATPTDATAPATITGVIIDAESRAVLDQTQVCVVGTASCTTSDAFGQYTLGEVVAGSRTLRVARDGYSTRDIVLTLTAGQTVLRNVMLTTHALPDTTPTSATTMTPTATSTATPTVAAGPATVVGTVINVSNGVPVGQAYVCVGSTEERCTMSDAFGQYRLSGVEAGNRPLRVTRSGYLAYDAMLVVGAGQTVEHDVPLMPPPTPTPIPTLRPMPWMSVVVPSGQGLPTFRIGRTEVTNGQYRACVDAGACTAPGDTERYGDPAYAAHPVVWVSRDQARVYAAWAGGSLPTPAQWLRACQGDDGRTYPWGSQPPDATRANYYGSGEYWTQPVGSFPAGASPFGALDMAGNVSEWVDAPDYIGRGGSYRHDPASVACGAIRGFGYLSFNHVGFRVVFPGS